MNDILFRVDASNINIGTGHLYRCLNLAKELKELSYSIVFVLRALPGNYGEMITRSGFQLIELPFKTINKYVTSDNKESWLGSSWKLDAEQTVNIVNTSNVDCVVVDHYSLDHNWHKLVLETGVKLVVIDDLANRYLDCNLLIDQSYLREDADYFKFTNTKTIKLLGSSYAILAADFYLKRGLAIVKKNSFLKSVNNILISFGGVDPNNYSQFVLEILNTYETSLNIEIIVGKGYKYLNELKRFSPSNQHNISIFQDIDSNQISNMMIEADLAFGSPGTSTWERCCLELPTVFVVNATNSDRIEAFVKDTSDNYLVNILNSKEKITKSIVQILKQKKNINRVFFNKIDGLGGRRVASKIHQLIQDISPIISTRKIQYKDKDLIYSWQLNKTIRKYFNNPSSPSYQEHLDWIKVRMNSSNVTELILYKKIPAGVVRVDFISVMPGDRSAFEVSIYVVPESQRLGVASLVLKYILHIFKYELLYANINIENVSSIKLFESHGFIKVSNSSYLYDYFRKA